ncbi:MAG TPA: PH domain-containing protein [Streptosporangiaceae bacterium]|nr:PH domain-containing protein [Streptosporangiaceae bacterium]
MTGPVAAGPPAGGPLPDRAAPPLARDASWHRLHPLSPLVRAGRQMMSLLVVLIGIAVLNQHQDGNLVADLVVIVAALVGGFVSWLVTRWQIADGVLRIDTGLLRRDSRRFPLSQVQAVDVVQTGLARLLGLAELQLRIAGGDSARGGRLACLKLADAEQLRKQLLALAAVPAGGVPAPATVPDPDGQAASAPAARTAVRTMFRVRAIRLPVAILLTRSGAIGLVVAIAIWLTAQFDGSAGVIAPFLPVALGVAARLWRQFNGEYGTTVALAQDGIRLRSGLVQTTAETIRPGRIQAVRLVEPLIWRALHWCRLEVDVAGARQRNEDRAEGQRLRALIPVGSRAEADLLIAELLGSPPLPSQPPPVRVRWKAPLSYHFLSWNGDDQYVVAARGRVCRQTTWIPLAKAQSIRWVQGPLQRRLSLATVHLDVAGKRVGVKVEDRDSAEALQILRVLPDLARAARSRAR